MMLLAHVIKTGGSAAPDKMAETLKTVKNWKGVTGTHTFDNKGDVVDKKVVLKIVKNGQFSVIRQ